MSGRKYMSETDNTAFTVESVKPNDTDLEMIKEAKKENDGITVDIETLAAKLGVSLEE